MSQKKQDAMYYYKFYELNESLEYQKLNEWSKHSNSTSNLNTTIFEQMTLLAAQQPADKQWSIETSRTQCVV